MFKTYLYGYKISFKSEVGLYHEVKRIFFMVIIDQYDEK